MKCAQKWLMIALLSMVADSACLITINNKTNYDIGWHLMQKRADGTVIKPINGSTKTQKSSQASLTHLLTNVNFYWVEPAGDNKRVLHPITDYEIKPELAGADWIFSVEQESVCGSVATDDATTYIKDACMPGDAQQTPAPPAPAPEEKKPTEVPQAKPEAAKAQEEKHQEESKKEKSNKEKKHEEAKHEEAKKEAAQ